MDTGLGLGGAIRQQLAVRRKPGATLASFVDVRSIMAQCGAGVRLSLDASIQHLDIGVAQLASSPTSNTTETTLANIFTDETV